LLCFVVAVFGSSHSEAPGTAKIGNADPTDFYMFQSYEPSLLAGNAFTTFIANWIPLQTPEGGPNYYSFSDDFFFELLIDNDGDCLENIVFQWIFSNDIGGNPNKIISPDVPLDFNFDCVNYAVANESNSGGLTVPVNGFNVPVALKVIGQIKAGTSTTGVLNWDETYSLSVINGLRNGTPESISISSGPNSGSTTFTKPFDYAGENTFPAASDGSNGYDNYANQYIYSIDLANLGSCGTDGKVFVGQRQESFSINLGQIFDLVNIVPVEGLPGAVTNKDCNNVLSGKNVGSFVLEIPTSCLLGATAILGAWVDLRQLLHVPGTDGFIYDNLYPAGHAPGGQVARLGSPLVNELVIGLRDKVYFNRGQPFQDTTNGFGFYVLYPSFPEILNILFLTAVNNGFGLSLTSLVPTLNPRTDLVAVFLTGSTAIGNQFPNTGVCEMLRLNTAIKPVAQADQDSLAALAGDFAGFPNGRRPGDDIVDIALSVMLGAFCYIPGNGVCTTSQAPVGGATILDGAPISALDFQNVFPYLNRPNAGGFDDGPDCPASTLVMPSIAVLLLALLALLLL